MAKTETLISARAVLSKIKPVQELRPFPREAAKPVFLSDLKEFDVHVGYGSFGKEGNLGYEGGKIIVDGKPSDKGLSMHPPSGGSSYVSYAIDGRYRWFHARAGLNDTSKKTKSALTFRVLGNGKVLWSSKPLQNRGHLADIRLDIRGVRTLRLEVNCPGKYYFAHAVWVDPQLLK